MRAHRPCKRGPACGTYELSLARGRSAWSAYLVHTHTHTHPYSFLDVLRNLCFLSPLSRYIGLSSKPSMFSMIFQNRLKKLCPETVFLRCFIVNTMGTHKCRRHLARVRGRSAWLAPKRWLAPMVGRSRRGCPPFNSRRAQLAHPFTTPNRDMKRISQIGTTKRKVKKYGIPLFPFFLWNPLYESPVWDDPLHTPHLNTFGPMCAYPTPPPTEI